MRKGASSIPVEEALIISPEQQEPSGATGHAPPAAARFRLASPAHLIALGFGSGLFPRAPGTVGTLWAWCVFIVLEDWLSPFHWAIVIGLSFLVGIWTCGRTARDVGISDHSAIVWDEVVAFWLVLMFLPTTWLDQLLGFAVFRFFDIVKPPPIGYFDARLKGGFGIMFDDLLAAFFTLLVFALWRAIGA